MQARAQQGVDLIGDSHLYHGLRLEFGASQRGLQLLEVLDAGRNLDLGQRGVQVATADQGQHLGSPLWV